MEKVHCYDCRHCVELGQYIGGGYELYYGCRKNRTQLLVPSWRYCEYYESATILTVIANIFTRMG
jgi:hypothetical protein